MNTLFKTVTSSNTSSMKRTPDDDILSFKSNIVESQSIHIRDLELDMFIGVHEHEKQKSQRVFVNAELEIEPNQNWDSDDIGSVVSYEDIVVLIKDLANKTHIELVETFAHQIIDACFDHSSQIQTVEITLDKPDVMDGVKSVGCSLKKSRI